MRIEKFTTKLQEALADAQSKALGQDNQYIESQHLLAALLDNHLYWGNALGPLWGGPQDCAVLIEGNTWSTSQRGA